MNRSQRKPLEYIKFFWRDFNRDTGHLSRGQRDGYLQILCAYYDNHGPLHELVVRKASGATDEEWRTERDLIAAFFRVDTAGRWNHKRVDAELKSLRETAIARSASGRKGGKKSGETRAAQAADRSKIEANASAKPKQKASYVRRVSGDATRATGLSDESERAHRAKSAALHMAVDEILTAQGKAANGGVIEFGAARRGGAA